MGSFVEVVLSLDFVEDTPDHVLAAFSALAGPVPEGAVALPTPVVEAWERFEPDWRDAGYDDGDGDPFEDEPWRHDWASWMSGAMGVQTTPHGSLVWSGCRWNLDCRFSWKASPETVAEALAWLAPFVFAYPDEPVLLGYAHHEYAPRPHLFWVKNGQWETEDLNPNDDYRL